MSNARSPRKLAERFAPARGLSHPIAQTIFSKLFRRAPEAPCVRERWETPDGDFLDIDLATPEGGGPKGFLILLHGLEGSSRSTYIRGTSELARRRGFVVIAMNFRGCGGQPNRLLRSYHSGETGDLAFVVGRVVDRWPGLAGGVVGFSLGANVLVKWLGESGARIPAAVRGGAAVSCPFDLGGTARWLDRATNAWIRAAFLPSLRRKALEKAGRYPGFLDERRIRTARTFRAIDEAYTAPAHGFESADEYWARSSSGRFLARISRPTLLVAATDDPLIPATCVPRREIAANPLLVLEASRRGGHVGFVAGSAFAPRFWAEERSVGFVEGLLAE